MTRRPLLAGYPAGHISSNNLQPSVVTIPPTTKTPAPPVGRREVADGGRMGDMISYTYKKHKYIRMCLMMYIHNRQLQMIFIYVYNTTYTNVPYNHYTNEYIYK